MFKMSTLERMVDVIPLCTGAGGTCPWLALGTSLRPSERGASASCPSGCPPSGCCAYAPVVPNKIPAPNSSSDSPFIICLLGVFRSNTRRPTHDITPILLLLRPQLHPGFPCFIPREFPVASCSGTNYADQAFPGYCLGKFGSAFTSRICAV